MPILWRYILSGYLKIFFLSVCTFIAVLLVSRFKEIARFAALSADWLKTGLFTVYQIPHILPLAIPISSLIAAILLFQRLSRTFELTALRASGQSLSSLLTPVLFTSLFFSICNFSLCGEISPFCRRESKALFFQETSANPLLLLQRHHLVKLKHAYVDMKIKEEGKTAKDLILIAHNESNQRLSLLSARKLQIAADKLHGHAVSIISHLHSDREDFFDPLILENQTSMSTAAPVLSAALKKSRPKLESNALNLRMLRIRMQGEGKEACAAHVEFLRRMTLSLAVFSFTFLGCVFGMEQGRTPTKKGIITAFSFTLTVLVSYFLGKELKNAPLFATLAFLFPHPIIWLASFIQLKRVTKGIW